MWDVDEQDGELAEAELAFFAQDDAGNVWNLGEYPEEYEDGILHRRPQHLDPRRGRRGGRHPHARLSVVGDRYLQGSVPSIQFLDCAEVAEEHQQVCVPTPTDCYEDVLVTHETSPLDPAGGIQTKAHAPGVGIVEVGAIDDPEGETLVLVESNQLDAAGLDAAREAALTLDVRAYQTASAVYGGTPPLGQPRQPPPQPVPPVVPLPPVPAPSPAAGVLPAATPPASTTKRKKARSKRRKCKRKRAQARARGDNVQRKKKPPRRCRRKRPRR